MVTNGIPWGWNVFEFLPTPSPGHSVILHVGPPLFLAGVAAQLVRYRPGHSPINLTCD